MNEHFNSSAVGALEKNNSPKLFNDLSGRLREHLNTGKVTAEVADGTFDALYGFKKSLYNEHFGLGNEVTLLEWEVVEDLGILKPNFTGNHCTATVDIDASGNVQSVVVHKVQMNPDGAEIKNDHAYRIFFDDRSKVSYATHQDEQGCGELESLDHAHAEQLACDALSSILTVTSSIAGENSDIPGQSDLL